MITDLERGRLALNPVSTTNTTSVLCVNFLTARCRIFFTAK